MRAIAVCMQSAFYTYRDQESDFRVRLKVTRKAASTVVGSWTVKIEKIERIFGYEAVLSPKQPGAAGSFPAGF